jgi:hypothetical protein
MLTIPGESKFVSMVRARVHVTIIFFLLWSIIQHNQIYTLLCATMRIPLTFSLP